MPRKRCSKCKRRRPYSCFTKNKRNPDGLNGSCKECKRRYERKYKRAYRSKRYIAKNNTLSARIDSLDQIDSVLREMAELKAGINHEKSACKKRISMIREYTNEVIEPWLIHQIALRTMLLDFLKRNEKKTFSRKYRFGTVRFSRGRLKIRLNVNLAKQKTGKP